jgi:hypothetical protein
MQERPPPAISKSQCVGRRGPTKRWTAPFEIVLQWFSAQTRDLHDRAPGYCCLARAV